MHPKRFSSPALASGLRDAFRQGYGRADLRQDLMAGAVVGVVALPLSMALAIASGVPPAHGLYTAIVAGALTGLLGGSRVQVSGPTAAFVVLLAPVSARYGLGGLVLASAMAGVVLCLFALARLGRLIQFVPQPVVTGFTAGIAVVIASLQIPHLMGITPGKEADFFPRMAALVADVPHAHRPDVIIGLLTLALLLLWPRVSSRVPGPLVALTAATLGGLGSPFPWSVPWWAPPSASPCSAPSNRSFRRPWPMA